MDRRRFAVIPVLILFITLIAPAGAIAKGPPKPVETAVNNLSYPALAVDSFTIAPLSTTSFTVPYAGDYPGLTAEEIAALTASGPWYAQKTTGNAWQADFSSETSVDVTYIDWSDNMETVSPKVRTPFRLEMVLFKALSVPMTGYTMSVLEYPSSSNELQGTNTSTYEGTLATVISATPKLIIQYLGSSVPTLTWDATKSLWTLADTTAPDLVPISFAPELNVGGKYVFGASSGGWKPSTAGWYRITFYVPSGSGVNLALGTIADYATGFAESTTTEGEGAVATAVLDTADNLTYIDVKVLPKGGNKG